MPDADAPAAHRRWSRRRLPPVQGEARGHRLGANERRCHGAASSNQACSLTGAGFCTHVIGADTIGDKQCQEDGADEDLQGWRERAGCFELAAWRSACTRHACMRGGVGVGGGACGARRRRLASPLPPETRGANQRLLLLTHVNSLQMGQGDRGGAGAEVLEDLDANGGRTQNGSILAAAQLQLAHPADAGFLRRAVAAAQSHKCRGNCARRARRLPSAVWAAAAALTYAYTMVALSLPGAPRREGNHKT